MKHPLPRRKHPVVHTDRAPVALHTSHIVQREASDRVVRVGQEAAGMQDLYHRLLTMGWGQFLFVTSAVYLLANAVFAVLFFLQPGSIANARPGSFWDAFFFSVETFATVGYGVLAPATDYANWVMTVETFVGLVTVAATTGVVFARISRPTARVKFAKVAVVAMHEGKPTLMIRMGNERRSQIVEANVTMAILRSRTTVEGRFTRRFEDLKLIRAKTPIFAISFTAMHVVDEHSPLFGMSPEDLKAAEIELLVTVTGLEETLGQTVHARASYVAEEILLGQRYVDIFGLTDDGRRGIDYSKFDLTQPDPI
jgi:inward rectifier potassium channel